MNYEYLDNVAAAKKEFLNSLLKDLKIWQSQGFWEAAFHQACGMASSVGEGEGEGEVSVLGAGGGALGLTAWQGSDPLARENQRLCDANTTFGHLGSFVSNMTDLGVRQVFISPILLPSTPLRYLGIFCD